MATKTKVSVEQLIEVARNNLPLEDRITASLWEGPAVHVDVELFKMSNEYTGARMLILTFHEVGESVIKVQQITPHNAEKIRRAKRAVELGLAVTIPEAEYKLPVCGVTEKQFRLYAEEFRLTATWGDRNFGRQVVGGSDDCPVYGDEDYIAPGFVFSQPRPGYSYVDNEYLIAYSADGTTKFSAWYGGGSCGCDAHLAYKEKSALIQKMDHSTRYTIEQLAALSTILNQEGEEVHAHNIAQAEEFERKALIKEFGLAVCEHC